MAKAEIWGRYALDVIFYFLFSVGLLFRISLVFHKNTKKDDFSCYQFVVFQRQGLVLFSAFMHTSARMKILLIESKIQKNSIFTFTDKANHNPN